MAKRKRCKHQRTTMETGSMLGSTVYQVKCLDCGRRFGTTGSKDGATQMFHITVEKNL